MISIVIPIHNEEPSILPLYDKLTSVMARVAKPYEILFVDDASTDRSFDLLANLVETDGRLKVIRLRRNRSIDERGRNPEFSKIPSKRNDPSANGYS